MKRIHLIGFILATILSVGLIGQDGFNGGLNSSGGGGGGGPVLNNNAYDSYRGNGVFGHTFPRGTVTASDPFVWSQTWNNSAVTFRGFDIAVTGTSVTDFDAASTSFRVLGGAAGTTCLLGVGPNAAGGCVLSVSIADSKIYAAGEVNNSSGGYTTTVDRFPFQAHRQYFDTVSANTLQIAAQSGGVSYTIMTGAAPALTSGWGTGATIVGNSSVGRITIGTSPGAAGVLTFVEAFVTNAPHCDFNNETSGSVPTKVTPTTALVTVTATLVAADKVSYHCVGFQ